ncbi:hypothetical protein RI103_34940 [Paraburkholderia sp. FT54]|uniref:hypothetical protein n=1 Tax=Paraburkholderia sp. FT54 TaxID=3074437 RepID=UPI0028774501|nr:hypothetical protein [Paraburkholderia sp. FT54]WNC95068.1 hypothetical protein RI103_34940 [Paraburkholderia sp. FT54]
MKYLSSIGMAATLCACAAQPPAGVQSVGTSQQSPNAVGHCIAQKWADRSQQQVVSQTTLANNMAMDVYVPGQQPPNGAAAVVRPNYQGPGTWVGFRASGGASGNATGDVSGCL